ncbi:c-type cytochrome [Novosphingobium umbonatum]|nr:c-type cytochrome [Novosphingobium umbonatum]
MLFAKGLALGALVISMAAAAHAAPAQAAPATPPAVFARCAVCHDATKGGPDKIGPNLHGVFGKKGGEGKFHFSAPFKAAKLKLDEATLDKWIEAPMTMVPGTAMAFPGIKDPAKRKEIVEYLKTLR